MLLYACETPNEVSGAQQYVETPNEEGGMPCSTVKYAWAVGGKDLCMPPDIGFVFDLANPWHVLEIHYDNPQAKTGVFDDSGVEITVRNGAGAAGYVRAGTA